jgi:hypothetical protein
MKIVHHGGAVRDKNGQRTPVYEIYMSAKGRCNCKTNSNYPEYGARGIEFKFNSFKEFLEAVGPRPSKKYSLDRRDNNGHYEPTNVRWATAKQQAKNRRKPSPDRINELVLVEYALKAEYRGMKL